MSVHIEDEYVHAVYSRLAVHTQAHPRSPRIWPNVKRFLSSLPRSSTLLDIGCGECKYQLDGGLVVGVDTCPDILLKVNRQDRNLDMALANALRLPFRSEAFDAVLFVSCLHHFASAERRREALSEAVRVLSPHGRLLVCVWAFEQPNGAFPSQDLLVPWCLHENPANGRAPLVRFHMDSTKEQRIINNSIPISVSSPSPWSLSSFVERLFTRSPKSFPPAIPRFLASNPRKELVWGVRRWSPMLGRRLASLLVSVEEQLADELSEAIVRDALAEALSTLRQASVVVALTVQVTFYRFYHVFRRGELESLVAHIPELQILNVQNEQGNWCMIAQKRAPPQPI